MVLGRAAPLGVEIDAVVVRVPSHVILLRARGATASGGVTFMRAFSYKLNYRYRRSEGAIKGYA